MRLIRALLGIVVLVLATHVTVSAQAIAGSQLSGVVRDSTGGAIPGAEVTMIKTDTGAIRTVFTGADGAYALPNLPVGPYQLKVVLQGFNTYVRDGIVLQVSSNPDTRWSSIDDRGAPRLHSRTWIITSRMTRVESFTVTAP